MSIASVILTVVAKGAMPPPPPPLIGELKKSRGLGYATDYT